MNKMFYMFMLLTLISTIKLSGQVLIGPEIGVSYLPFTLYVGSTDTENKSNRLDA